MTADLTSESGVKFQVQLATITIPYINEAEVRFCRFLEYEHSTQIGISQAHFYAQFGGKKAKWLDAPSIVHSEFETFEYPKLPIDYKIDVHEKLKERGKSFVRFAAEEDNNTFVFDFVLSAEITEKIRANSKSQKLMHIFNVSFDSSLQIDPTLAVSSVDAGTPDLLFRSEYAGFIAYGLIEDHFAVTVEEYEKQTCHDPIMQYANSTYYAPALYDLLMKDTNFDDYLDDMRKRIN